MNFEQIIYKRPNIEKFQEKIEEYLKEFILAVGLILYLNIKGDYVYETRK